MAVTAGPQGGTLAPLDEEQRTVHGQLPHQEPQVYALSSS